MKIMASGPITSWEIVGERVEKVSDFIFWGSKITADGDCSHEIKTLTPWKESMTNLESILKNRNITLPKKVHLVKAMVFLVVMYGLEKAMATHSSTLAWKSPWTEEPGRLQSMGSLRVRHN